MKTRTETRVKITHSNQRARLITNPDGSMLDQNSAWAWVRFPNGAVQRHPIHALKSTDNKTRTRALEEAKESAIEAECHAFLAANPADWQSVPVTHYEEE